MHSDWKVLYYKWPHVQAPNEHSNSLLIVPVEVKSSDLIEICFQLKSHKKNPQNTLEYVCYVPLSKAPLTVSSIALWSGVSIWAGKGTTNSLSAAY